MISQIREIFKWRQLLFSLVLKDLKTKYRKATGGFSWLLVAPLVQAGIFIFIFRFIFKIKIENYTLFLLSGLFPWSFLKSSLDGAANSILVNANLVRKTYFPREILPISNIFTNIINFLFTLIILFIFSLFYRISLFPVILWLLLIIFIQIILIIGISLFLTGLNTTYRETQFIMDIILLLWFYATPIVYSLEMARNTLPASLFLIYKLNPMTGIICAYQDIFLYGAIPNMVLLLESFLVAVMFFILGFLSFHHYEEIFVDLV